MISAVALGPAGAVFSVSREKGTSHVVANTRDGATSLYATPDKLESLWVSPEGNVHAAGKRYHTNVAGAWRASKLPEVGFTMWGSSDEDLFLGGINGAILRRRDGAWTAIGNVGELVMGIHGIGAAPVYFVGSFAGIGIFDGATFSQQKSPGPGYWQNVLCASPQELWLCGTDQVCLRDGAKARVVATINDRELYGIGVGTGGVFAHAGHQLLRQTGSTLEVVHDNENRALMVQRATYATCMTSNGTRVVAGGARSVLVEDGKGFVEWPALGAPVTAKAAKVAKAAKAAKVTKVAKVAKVAKR